MEVGIKWRTLLGAWLAWAVVASSSGAANNSQLISTNTMIALQARFGTNAIPFEELIKAMPPSERMAYASNAAKFGLILPLPEVLRSDLDPEAKVKFVRDLQESIPGPLISAMEEGIGSTKSDRLKLQYAAVAYRYGKAVGLPTLCILATNGSAVASKALKCLAVGREPAAERAVITAIPNGELDRDTLLELGEWKAPGIRDALVQRYLKRGPEDRTELAIAVALQAESKFHDEFVREFERAKNPSTKCSYAAAACASANTPGPELEFLIEQLRTNDSSKGRFMFAAEALGYVDQNAAEDALRETLLGATDPTAASVNRDAARVALQGLARTRKVTKDDIVKSEARKWLLKEEAEMVVSYNPAVKDALAPDRDANGTRSASYHLRRLPAELLPSSGRHLHLSENE
jgi:hypothetical protein